jgi:deoxycytidylate deaminase
MNAIANANMQGISCKDADIYITLSPCAECMKLLVQHQIKNVFYLEKYRDMVTTNIIAENTPTINLVQLDENSL